MLRPYQQRAVDEIRKHAASGGRGVILQMATGAGKTKCFTNVLSGAYAKGKTGIMVVRGKALVQQASDRLARDGLPHGIYQGGNTARINERIMVCSVDTLYRRQVAPQADILVIDECHLAHSDSYKWLLDHEAYAKTFRLGVSATPHHKKGMRHIADKLIMPIRMAELIADGFLVGARYFVPYVPDLKGIKKSNGDFDAKQLGERSESDVALAVNAVKIWDENLRGKRSLVYATSIKHAEGLTAKLRAAGARIDLITAATPDHERAALIADLEGGRLDAITSVGVLTTGVDIPSLEAIMCCRPTDSYNLWIQIVGRGTRPFPGKTHFDFYDLSGNIIKHGPIEAELVGSLDGVPPAERSALTRCVACYAIFPTEAGRTDCPQCGASLQSAEEGLTGERALKPVKEVDEVEEYKIEPWEIDYPDAVDLCRRMGWRKGKVYHLIREKHGEEAAKKAWARARGLKQWPVKERATTPSSPKPSSVG